MRVRIRTNYPNDVDWLLFSTIRDWDYPVYRGFQYDYISDSLIKEALASPELTNVNIVIDWEDDTYLRNNKFIREELKHPLRIAKLVEHIKNEGAIDPVSLDTIRVNNCCSCIYNGHHRLRALTYLDYKEFPVYCSGEVSVLETLIKL